MSVDAVAPLNRKPIVSAAHESAPARLLKDHELEELLDVCRGWAAKDRCGKALIPHVKIGRAVRYRIGDALDFIEKSIRRSTQDRAA